MTTRLTRPASARRLVARLTVSAALAVGLAGGFAPAASAAPAPADQGRLEAEATAPIVVDPVPTVPGRPGLPDPDLTTCEEPTHGGNPKECQPDICEPVTGLVPEDCRPDRPDPCKALTHVPEHCRPDPCDDRRPDPERCPDPCDERRSDRPEHCRPEPCEEGEDEPDHKPADRRLRPVPEKCPEPKGCDDPERCDRPVPGKPNFTG